MRFTHASCIGRWVVTLGRDCNVGLWGHLCPKGSSQRIVKHLLRVLTGFFLLSLLDLGQGDRGMGRRASEPGSYRWPVHPRLSYTAPSLYSSSPVTANIPAGKQRTDPGVPALLESLGSARAGEAPLQHHRAQLYLLPALGGPEREPCGLQHRRDLYTYTSGFLREQR